MNKIRVLPPVVKDLCCFVARFFKSQKFFSVSLSVFLLLAHCIAVAAIDEKRQCPQGNWKNKLVIEVMNVGQGDSTFIRTPSGKTILIDGGYQNRGKETVLPILKKCFGVQKLDYVVSTHMDGDHWRGIVPVLEELGADTVYDPLDQKTVLGAFKYKKYQAATKHSDNRRVPHLGDRSFRWIGGKGFKIEVVAVNGRVLSPDKKNKPIQVSGVFPRWIDRPEDGKAKNGASIALLLSYGDFRYYTGGDLTGGGDSSPDVETPVGEYVGPVTGMKSNHHGSATSNNQNFLDKLQPQFVVVSVGNDGNARQWRLPNQAVMQRFFHLPSVQKIFLTNIDERRTSEPFFKKVTYGPTTRGVSEYKSGDIIIQVSPKGENVTDQQDYSISVDGQSEDFKVAI